MQVDDGILKEMEAHGFDPRKTLECLMRNDCNYITATYFLLAEGRAANGSLSLSRKSSSSGVQLNKAVSTSPVGKWDDSAIAVHRRHDAALNRVVA